MTGEVLVGLAAEQPLLSRMGTVLRRDTVTVVAETASPDELVRACADRRPHVAAVSWSACRPDGPTGVRRLAAAMRGTRIVVVLPFLDRVAIRGALAAGAEGAVVASHMLLTLPVVVRSVWLGQASVPRDVAGDLETPVLSHREGEVLALVADGLSNAQIAHRLCVTESTVKSHLSSLFAKLGVHSRREATAVIGDRVLAPGIQQPIVRGRGVRAVKEAKA